MGSRISDSCSMALSFGLGVDLRVDLVVDFASSMRFVIKKRLMGGSGI